MHNSSAQRYHYPPKVGCSQNSRLWYMAHLISGKQCHNKCSNNHHLCEYVLPVFLRVVHCAVLKFTPCFNNSLLQLTRDQNKKLSRCRDSATYKPLNAASITGYCDLGRLWHAGGHDTEPSCRADFDFLLYYMITICQSFRQTDRQTDIMFIA